MTRKAARLGIALAAVAAGTLLALFAIRPDPDHPASTPPAGPAGSGAQRPPALTGQLDGASAAFADGTVVAANQPAGSRGKNNPSVSDASPPAARTALAGATVVAQELTAGRDRALSPLAAVAEADARGRFHLGPLAGGYYRLTAAAPGHLPASRELTLKPGQTLTAIELLLQPGGFVLSGRVLDAGAGAIPGARVRAHLFGDAPTAPVAVTQSDRNGGYKLTLPGGFHTLAAEADGYAPASSVLWLEASTSRDLRLIPAAAISGQVVHKGEPVPSARVQAYTSNRYTADADTAADGSFRFNALEPGDYHLVARAGSLVGRLAVPVTAQLGTRVEGVLIEVEAGPSVAGHVYRDANRPVPGARVNLFAAGQLRTETTTDAQGAYRLEGLLPGPQIVRASAPELVPAGHPITVADGDLTGIDIKLAEAAQVRGRVIDAKEQPCPGTVVHVENLDETRKIGRLRTDDEGRFVSEEPAGRIVVTADGGPRGRAQLDLGKLAPGERREVTVKLSSTGPHVSGTVRWKDGAPAPGIEVTASDLRDDRGVAQTTTGPDGRYELGPFNPGALLMVQSRAPSATAVDPPSGRRTVRVEGSRAVSADFTLARFEGTIRGLVAGPDGQTLAGAVVGSDGGNRLVTDEQGRFVFEGMGPDEHSVWAQYPGLLPEQVEVPAGQREVRLQLRRGALLAGAVEGAAGRPPGYCSVWARPSAAPADTSARDYDDPVRAVCGGAGAFELRGLRPGVYDLYATTLDDRSGGLPGIRVSEGEHRRDLRIKVTGGLTVIGSVVDLESRKPVPGARVRGTLEQTTVETVTDGQGKFHFPDVPRGLEVDVQVEAPAHISNSQTRVTPAAGETLDFGVLPLLAERPGPPPTGRAGIILGSGPDGVLAVNGTVEDLPAARAGVTRGDVVIGIDGHDLQNVNLPTAVAMIRGPSGAPLILQLRGPDRRVRTVRIVRA